MPARPTAACGPPAGGWRPDVAWKRNPTHHRRASGVLDLAAERWIRNATSGSTAAASTTEVIHKCGGYTSSSWRYCCSGSARSAASRSAARPMGAVRVRGTVAPHRGRFLMPVGYWWTVALISWGVVCALTRWRRLGSFSAIPALLVSELPFIVGYLLIASTVLALVDGDLGSPGGAAGAAVALLALAGLVVVVRRAMRAHAALHNAGRPRRPWGRILRAPFFPGRRDVVRVRGLAYGDGPRPHAGRVPPPRPAGQRTDPAALPRRRLPLRQQGPRSAAADPAPDQPARFRLRERELPAAAARDPRRPGGRRARARSPGYGRTPRSTAPNPARCSSPAVRPARTWRSGRCARARPASLA